MARPAYCLTCFQPTTDLGPRPDLFDQYSDLERLSDGMNVLWHAMSALWQSEKNAYEEGLSLETMQRMAALGDFLSDEIGRRTYVLYRQAKEYAEQAEPQGKASELAKQKR